MNKPTFEPTGIILNFDTRYFGGVICMLMLFGFFLGLAFARFLDLGFDLLTLTYCILSTATFVFACYFYAKNDLEVMQGRTTQK